MKSAALLRLGVMASAIAATFPVAAADFFWSAGSFAPGVTAPQPMGAADTLFIQSGPAKSFLNSSWTNDGTVRWEADAIGGGSASVASSGLWDVQSDSATFVWAVSGRPEFVNSGEFRKSAGLLTTFGSWGFTSNGGTVNAETGAIAFNGGVTTFNSGTRFVGDGTVRVTAGATFNDDFASDSLELAAGTFAGNGALLSGGVATAGVVHWTGGVLNGSWELAVGTTLTAGDGGGKQLSSVSLVNRGTILWQTGNTLNGASSTLTNNGLFEAQASASLLWNVGGRPSFVNASTGTVRAAAGVTLTNASFDFVNEGGTLEALAGGAIVYDGGVNRFDDGTRFIGAGQHIVAGGARFVGGYTADTLILQAGTFIGGDGVTPGSGATANGTTTWTGGTLTGTWAVASGQTLLGAAGGGKQLSSVSLVNDGTILWQTGNALNGASSTLTNNGLFEAQASATMQWNVGGRPSFVNSSTGTVRATAGVTLTNASFDFRNDGGTLEALAGAVIVYDGGSHRFNDGTRFVGAGQHILMGSGRFVDTYTADTLILQSGTMFGGDGVTAGSKAIAKGTTTWSGGSLAGSWEVAAGQTFIGATGGGKQLAAVSLENNGTILWQTDDNLNGASSTVTNNDIFDIRTDADIVWNVGARPSFVNTGVFVKSAGAGETSLASISLANTGTMDVQSGSIRLPDGFTNGGTLTGGGAFTTNLLTNAGHVAPGASPGNLTINGNFVQSAGGFLDIELGSLLATDLLVVNGAASLNGTLALHCFALCSFAVGDELVILDSTGDLTGTFASVTLAGFATGDFDVVYDTLDDRVLLRATEAVTAAVPEPGTWGLMLAGLAMLGGLARRRRG